MAHAHALALPERLKAIAERIKTAYHAERVILYGSYARGEATEDSDVDLLIIAPTRERFFQRMASVYRLIRDLRKGIPLSPIVLTPREVEAEKRKGNAFILDIVHEGVEL